MAPGVRRNHADAAVVKGNAVGSAGGCRIPQPSEETVKVAAVVPCFNAGRYVEQAIESLLAQSYAVSLVVCVDDGSTDQTWSVLQRAAERYPNRVRCIRQDNAGGNAARNRGLRVLQADYVQFLDADDYLLPDKVANQVALAAAPGPDFIAGRSRWHDAFEEVRPPGSWPDDPWDGLVEGRLGNTCSNLWRREALEAVGGWNEAYRSSQETELMFRLLREGHDRVAYSDEAGTVTRRVAGSVSRADSREKSRRHVDVRMDMLRHFHDRGRLTADRERALFQQLFRFIRILHRHDPGQAAIEMEQLLEMVGRDSIPAPYRRYVRLYRWFGYRPVEAVSRVGRAGRDLVGRGGEVPGSAASVPGSGGRE
jgi:glycosyltransferase involved in cell wall biosynthesis